MKKYTERGFRNYTEFVDLSGTTITVRESSLATERAVRILTDNPADGTMPVGFHKPLHMDSHLSIKQVKKLIKALEEFLKSNT